MNPKQIVKIDLVWFSFFIFQLNKNKLGIMFFI